MNKRYMDFAPARPVKTVKKIAPQKPVVKPVQKVTSKSVPKPVSKAVAAKNPTPKTTPSKTPALGVVEDLVVWEAEETIVDKAPSAPHFKTAKSAIVSAKAQKIGNQSSSATTKPMENIKHTNSTYKTPKSPFINLDKITKRPLSKNVYRKDVKIPVEEPKGPITIISKPEKDNRIGLVITIIITIILGAVAGTIAFLLLPK